MADDKPVSYVQMMRGIRDQLNREIAGMNIEEEKRWLKEQLAKNELKDPSRDRAQPRRSA